MKKYYQAIQAFHEKFKMKGTNNEDMQFRLNLIIEELGELAQAITKGKPKEDIVEENVDLLNLVLGNFISMDVSFEQMEKAFWSKHRKIMKRKVKLITKKRFRVSEFNRS